MLSRTSPLLAIVSLAILCATPVRAQSTQQPAPAPSDPSATAAPQAAAPDGKPAPASPTNTTRKIWTEEEMAGLHNKGADSISQPGNKPNPDTPAPHAKGTASTKDAKWYHDQIFNLRAKLPPLEKNIAELEAALSGKPTGDAVKSSRPSGVKTDDWATQLADAQKQRDDILAKIAALQDEARHKGISPNALP